MDLMEFGKFAFGLVMEELADNGYGEIPEAVCGLLSSTSLLCDELDRGVKKYKKAKKKKASKKKKTHKVEKKIEPEYKKLFKNKIY